MEARTSTSTTSFQIRNPALVLEDVLQRQRRDLTREPGRTRLVPGRFEAAPVAARRGVDDRVVYGVKRDHAVPVRDRPVHDRDAVRRVRVRGDERREVPVDARLRLDQHGVVDHVEREPLERVVGVAESEVRPDLQHGTARAPRRRPGGTAWPGGGAAVCYGGGRRRGFGRCGSGSASPGSWLRSSAPTAAARSTALWAALIIHARSALASVRTVKPNFILARGSRSNHGCGVYGAIGYSSSWK